MGVLVHKRMLQSLSFCRWKSCRYAEGQTVASGYEYPLSVDQSLYYLQMILKELTFSMTTVYFICSSFIDVFNKITCIYTLLICMMKVMDHVVKLQTSAQWYHQ